MIYVLAAMALGLTFTMFLTKNMMLGFPSGIFWALCGGYCYQHSTATWDLYYLTFFACMGMLIFSIYAAFALRNRDIDPAEKDWMDSGSYLDEQDGKAPLNQYMRDDKMSDDHSIGTSDDDNDNKPTYSRQSRSQGIRERARRRRVEGVRVKPRWGEFK